MTACVSKWWGLVNPDVGTHAVAVTLSAAVNSVTCGTLYRGVHQEAPTEALDSNAAVNPGPAEVDAELTITSVTDECRIHSALVTEDPSVIRHPATMLRAQVVRRFRPIWTTT